MSIMALERTWKLKDDIGHIYYILYRYIYSLVNLQYLEFRIEEHIYYTEVSFFGLEV